MITKKEVEYVAGLAKLALTEEERDRFTEEFCGILEYLNRLDSLDTVPVEPMACILPYSNVFREDLVEPSMDREKVLENAPDSLNGCFRVPRVI
ncbi:MAG: Asp-tRNA(Asn)/Glu-tRNA(Gln) amidotransferase subunit GatC [Clostridiales bacterium]|nr:Asp-tRNA(Asn)/Glu-tRNA(Gln) amidotransferase subunit GatC [Clostridiales bacterium]